MAEMALGYGSEFQLLRYLGHHRFYLDEEIKKVIGKGDITWMDYPINDKRDSCDGEWTEIECFKKRPDYNHIKNEWGKFWPQRGNAHNWDGIFIQNKIWYFVEAKAHLEEAHSKCTAKDSNSIGTITRAFEKTCGNKQLAEKWQQSNCYQLANRLAFIYFCTLIGIKAKLLYISFVNGYRCNPTKNVIQASDWENKWKEEYKTLELNDELKSDIYHVTIDCEKGCDTPNF